MQCALWYYSLNVRLKSEQPIFDALLPPKLWLLHIFTLLSSGCDCLCLLLWYISCELVIVDLIVCTLKRVLLRMQYVMEYPHMILLTKQHFTTIQLHTVLDNHPHPHFIFSIFCKSYIKLFFICVLFTVPSAQGVQSDNDPNNTTVRSLRYFPACR